MTHATAGKPKIVPITGAGACAQAMRQINPDVVAAFPITPSTQVVEDFSTFVANGQVDTEFVTVESEHSAMSACIGASAAGGRVMTATSSAGMAYMWELLYVAASMRQPVLMTLVNRALTGPINIHCDHSDSMGARDAGWIQLYSENNQEAYDNLVMAARIAEHPDIRLPLMVCQDGFITSHSIQTMQLEDDKAVRSFVGPYKPYHSLLDTKHPVTWGALDLQDYYIEHKRGQEQAMRHALRVIQEVSDDFAKTFGRQYGLFEEYRLEDADIVIVALNSAAGEIKEVIDEMRSKGEKVGLLKIRSFRPFPYAEIGRALSNARIVTVLDRSASFGAHGPLFTEISTAVCNYSHNRPLLLAHTFGLGGRELTLRAIEHIISESRICIDKGEVGDRQGFWVNVRGDKL
jgi:pyruvate ferredoxin oxidoreductase alpha subunit